MSCKNANKKNGDIKHGQPAEEEEARLNMCIVVVRQNGKNEHLLMNNSLPVIGSRAG